MPNLADLKPSIFAFFFLGCVDLISDVFDSTISTVPDRVRRKTDKAKQPVMRNSMKKSPDYFFR
jgi:hypothetical protein